jgi:hypothetical protein
MYSAHLLLNATASSAHQCVLCKLPQHESHMQHCHVSCCFRGSYHIGSSYYCRTAEASSFTATIGVVNSRCFSSASCSSCTAAGDSCYPIHSRKQSHFTIHNIFLNFYFVTGFFKNNFINASGYCYCSLLLPHKLYNYRSTLLISRGSSSLLVF